MSPASHSKPVLRMAAGIPGAQFVALQGRNHLFLETEPAFGQFLEHTRAFLAT